MGLVDIVKRSVSSPKSMEDFRDAYLERLIESRELRGYFFDEDGRRKEDDVSKHRYSELVRMLDDSYAKYGKAQYEGEGFFRRWIAKPLRKAGAAAGAFSHYVLNMYASPEGYALAMLPALGAMTAADVIEGAAYLYHNHSGYDILRIPKIVAESLLEKGLAIIPVGASLIPEATLGNTKFDRAVAGKVLYHARNEFIKAFGKYETPERQYSPEVIIFPRGTMKNHEDQAA